MPHLLMQLKIKDFDAWKPVYDEHDAERVAHGQLSARVFQSADDPNSVVILQEWKDAEGFQKFYTSDTFREAVQRAGVMGPPDRLVLREVT